MKPISRKNQCALLTISGMGHTSHWKIIIIKWRTTQLREFLGELFMQIAKTKRKNNYSVPLLLRHKIF